MSAHKLNYKNFIAEGGEGIMRNPKTKRGQSTVEYVIVFTAIVTAVIYASVFLIKPAVNATYNQAGNAIQKGGVYLGNKIGFGFHGGK